MLFVPSSQLEEGMYVAENVHDHYGRVLIARGQRLGTFHIERLQKFGIYSLFIEPARNGRSGAPGKSQLRRQCEEVAASALPAIGAESGTAGVPDPVAVAAAAAELVTCLVDSRKSVLTFSGVAEADDAWTRHAVNGAAVAVAMGVDFRLSTDTLLEIGSSMLLHDLGLLMLPPGLTRRHGPPRSDVVQRIKAHPILGYEHVVKCGALTPTGADLLLSHHERLDGTGYPQGLHGDRLTLPHRIVAAAEAFISLTADRWGIAGVLPDAALSWMLDASDTLFDRQVVLALGNRVALYPDGTAVRLSTGEVGVVAGTMAHAPRQPVVLVNSDKHGKPLRYPLIVDLSREQDRAIVRCARTLDALNCGRGTRGSRPEIDPILAGLG